MSIERNSDFYNQYYFKSRNEYNCHYTKSIYFEMWKRVLNLIPDSPITIFEAGCGTGQFAEMLFEERKEIIYSGIDFSEVAITRAKKNNPEKDFQCQSIYNVDIPQHCLIISLETMEHIDDFKFIEKIPMGVEVIFSIPDFAYQSHIRYFKDITEVVFRYYQKIRFDYIEKFDKWFICKGTTI